MAAQASKVKITTYGIKIVTYQEYRKHCLENDKKNMDLAVAEEIIKKEWGQHLNVLNTLFLRKDCFISPERVFLFENAHKDWRAAGFPNETPVQVKENLKKALFCKCLESKQKEIIAEKLAKKQGHVFPIRFSTFYSDKAPGSARKRLEILDKVLLKEDGKKNRDPNTIYVSVEIYKLLQFLQKCSINDFEKTLKGILPSEYHEWKQKEVKQKKSSSLSIPTVSDMVFFPSPPPTIYLKQIHEALSKISPFDGHFILSDKYAERFGSRLFNPCNGMTENQVGELAQRLKQECFVDAEKWRDGGYSVLIIYGVTDSKKFLQEDTQEKLRELLVNRKGPSQSSASIPNGPG
jgi:hypothetical protein